MRPFFIRTLVSATLVCAGGLTSFAQQYPNDPYHSQPDPNYRGPYGDPRYQNPGYENPSYPAPGYGAYGDGLFERVQADLTRAESGSYRSQDRIEHARHEVYEFQNRLSRGRFDKGKLDRAISAVQHAADGRWIRGPDRAALQEDADRMREFRAARGSGYYGDRRYGPGYR